MSEERNGGRTNRSANQRMWSFSRDRLGDALEDLGFSREIATMLASQLGSPKAIDRMTSYLRQARPRDFETIADEMLAICEEIAAWKRKKESEYANEHFNDIRDETFANWETGA